MKDEESHQLGCIWGLVNVFDYHIVRKMINHRKNNYAPTRRTRNQQSLSGGWNTLETSTYQNDAYEERLLDDKDRLHHSCRASKKRSFRARLKALICEEVSKENSNTFKPSLQRTYSIHHLESVDDDGFNKICSDWKNQVLFLPKDAANASSQSSQIDVEPHTQENDAVKDDPANVFEIFKVDKDLLLKNSDKRSTAFGLSTKAKFSKSRSFPAAKLKLESKQKEVWPFPKENKSQTERFGENVIRKRTNRRSFSMVESLDKYAWLLDNSSEKDPKLNSSKSLKVSNEAPLYFRRIHSLSYVDSDYSNLNFDVPADNRPSVVVENDSSSGMQNIEDEDVTDDQNVEMQIEEDSGSNAEIFEIADKVTDKSPKKKYSDLDYVRHLLDESGIAVEMKWHSSEQPLSPQLFEELERRWPHEEQDEWHHKMVFDLVNEALVELYDVSFPYYPKALSSSCHVPPFPVGNCIVEDVCRRIFRFGDVKAESLDLGWMNLQLETEFIAIHLEDIIFNQLLDEELSGMFFSFL